MSERIPADEPDELAEPRRPEAIEDDEPDQAARAEEQALLRRAEGYRAEPHTAPLPPIWPEPTTAPPLSAPTPAPKQRRETSALGRIALFAALLALGVTGTLHLAGLPIGLSGYLVALLITVGAALLVGAWIGRARWLIPVGVLLSVLLAITSAVETAGLTVDGAQRWQPTSAEQVQSSYTINLGDATVDLSGVDFTDQSVDIELTVNSGNMTVRLPPDVDLEATARVRYGNAALLGQEVSAAAQNTRTFSNLGLDQQAGPGTVRLDITVNAGNLEVRR